MYACLSMSDITYQFYAEIDFLIIYNLDSKTCQKWVLINSDP